MAIHNSLPPHQAVKYCSSRIAATRQVNGVLEFSRTRKSMSVLVSRPVCYCSVLLLLVVMMMMMMMMITSREKEQFRMNYLSRELLNYY